MLVQITSKAFPRRDLRFQESLNFFYDAKNEMRVMAQRLRDMHVVTKVPILDNYCCGELSLLFYAQSLSESDVVRRPLYVARPKPSEDLPTLIFHFNSINMPGRQNWNKKAVLVSDVHTVNGPNGTPHRKALSRQP